ncbi:MAG: Swt1 family HEPN domain-containing protein [Microbacteriaceae bacterium]
MVQSAGRSIGPRSRSHPRRLGGPGDTPPLPADPGLVRLPQTGRTHRPWCAVRTPPRTHDRRLRFPSVPRSTRRLSQGGSARHCRIPDRLVYPTPEGNITGTFKPGWYPFDQALGKAGKSYAIEVREVRNTWAHNGTFTDDDAYRALDTTERLLNSDPPTCAEAPSAETCCAPPQAPDSASSAPCTTAPDARGSV